MLPMKRAVARPRAGRVAAAENDQRSRVMLPLSRSGSAPAHDHTARVTHTDEFSFASESGSRAAGRALAGRRSEAMPASMGASANAERPGVESIAEVAAALDELRRSAGHPDRLLNPCQSSHRVSRRPTAENGQRQSCARRSLVRLLSRERGAGARSLPANSGLRVRRKRSPAHPHRDDRFATRTITPSWPARRPLSGPVARTSHYRNGDVPPVPVRVCGAVDADLLPTRNRVFVIGEMR